MLKPKCATCAHYRHGQQHGSARDGVPIIDTIDESGLCERPARGWFGVERPANVRVLNWWSCSKHTRRDADA